MGLGLSVEAGKSEIRHRLLDRRDQRFRNHPCLAVERRGPEGALLAGAFQADILLGADPERLEILLGDIGHA